MTDENWKLENWYVDFPAIGTFSGPIVNMPLPMKAEKVQRFILGEVTQEALRCLSVQAELAALLICLATVDYMAGFYVGHKSSKQDFSAFMQVYFPEIYRNYLDVIYDQLRSGLIHNLVALNPWYGKRSISFHIHPNTTNHLQMNDDGEITFSVQTFLLDVKRAWVMYAYDLIMKGDQIPEIVVNFNRRFNKLDGIGAFMIRVPD
ncbi:MAG: hypothetical protein AB1894_16135 [Chloroflexota bacterium]